MSYAFWKAQVTVRFHGDTFHGLHSRRDNSAGSRTSRLNQPADFIDEDKPHPDKHRIGPKNSEFNLQKIREIISG